MSLSKGNHAITSRFNQSNKKQYEFNKNSSSQILSELQSMLTQTKIKNEVIDHNVICKSLYKGQNDALDEVIIAQRDLIAKGLPPIIEKTLAQESIVGCEARVQV